MRYLTLLALALAAPLCVLGGLANAETGTLNHREECRKLDTGGCTTANPMTCQDVRADRVILVNTLNLSQSGGPKAVWCAPHWDGKKTLTATLPNGFKVNLEGAQKLCLDGNAESGAGPGGINSTAHVNCFAAFEVQE